jgi:steroid delta-isomerase-like uncharacterized protein
MLGPAEPPGFALSLRSMEAIAHQEDIMAQATAISPKALLNAAKALVETYNAKDWNGARAAITADFVYEEMGTGRRLTGADAAIEAFKGWAQAFPDSAGTYRSTHLAENGTVVLEVTWTGTHRGPLQTPDGPIAPTGKRIDIPACMVIEIAGEKAKAQRHYFDMMTLLRQLGATA